MGIFNTLGSTLAGVQPFNPNAAPPQGIHAALGAMLNAQPQPPAASPLASPPIQQAGAQALRSVAHDASKGEPAAVNTIQAMRGNPRPEYRVVRRQFLNGELDTPGDVR
jgi:hypothetical protein